MNNYKERIIILNSRIIKKWEDLNAAMLSEKTISEKLSLVRCTSEEVRQIQNEHDILLKEIAKNEKQTTDDSKDCK